MAIEIINTMISLIFASGLMYLGFSLQMASV